MASFLTQCPGCMTSFRVSDAQMEAADGMVRCGACLSVFSAPANRITIRQPVDPSQLPVLEPEADLQAQVSRAGATAPRPLHRRDTHRDDDELDADSPYAEQHASDLWMTDARDRDVPLGDLSLELRAADHADTEFEDDDNAAEDDAFDDFVDEDAEPAPDKTPQFRIVEEYNAASSADDESTADDDDDEFDAEEAYGNDEDEDEDEADDDAEYEGDDASIQQDPRHRHATTPLPLLGRDAKVATDRRGLREYLATLEDKDALDAPDDDDLDDHPEPATLNERPAVQRTLRFVGLLVLNLVLLAILMLQYVNANLDTLSRSQRLAPLMDRVCRVLECPLPQQGDLASLSSQDLLIRSHPRFAGALEVSFIFRNDSPDAQPFPAIELGFSDAADQVLANRLFQPADYLPPELQPLRSMPAQSTLQIMLEVADPGSKAVNYSIGFRSP